MEADLLVLIQSGDVEFLPILEKRRAAGLKTLVEYNDNFYEPQPWSPSAGAWNIPQIRQTYELFMQLADGLIVTGPGLEELFQSKFKTPVHILENHHPYELTDFESVWNRKDSKKIHIGWAGSLGHIADLLSLQPLFHRWLDQFPNVHLHAMGNESIPSLLRLPNSRFSFTPWGGMKEYFEFLAGLHLGIAPQRMTAYNRCRSDIKAIEFASQACLPVVQDSLPYTKWISNTSLPKFQTQKELDEIGDSLAGNPNELKSKARIGFEYVKSQRLHFHRGERAELYEKYLPKNLRSPSWKLSEGFHYVVGDTGSTPSSHEQTLAQAQKLWNESKQREVALTFIQSAAKQNPWSAEIAVAHCKMLMGLRRGEIGEVLENAQKAFPLDLRFPLMRLLFVAEASSALREWEKFCIRLEESNWGAKKYFHQEIAATLARHLRQFPEIVQIAERLNGIYERQSLPILFELAEHSERTGDFVKSEQIYAAITDAKRSFDLNQGFLTSVSEGYLEAFKECLQARVQEGF